MTDDKNSSILNKLINQLRGDTLNEIEFEKNLIQMKDMIKTIRVLLSENLDEFDITTTHLAFLIHLLKSENGLSMAQLTSECLCDKAHTTRMIKELEKKELVFRNQKYEGERNYKICLTEKGKILTEKAFDVFKDNRNKLIHLYSDDEQKQIMDTFRLITERISHGYMRKGN